MKKTYPIFILTILIFTLISCDPARILVIQANKPNTSVTLYANSNILPHPNDSISKKIVIKVPSTDSSIKRDTIYFYGLGGWGDDSFIPKFSQNIDSIIINNNDQYIILKNQTDITAYLLKHRYGFAKRKLIIKAN